MRSLRKTLRNQRLKTHQLISAWLRPKTEAVGRRYRLAARIRLANKRAAQHPKRTFAVVTGTLLCVLIGSIALDSFTFHKQEPQVEDIASMDAVFNGFHAIQANKSYQQNTLQQLAVMGQDTRRSLDSLIAIPRKSHSDSIRIVQHYRQLERIVNSLKAEQGEINGACSN